MRYVLWRRTGLCGRYSVARAERFDRSLSVVDRCTSRVCSRTRGRPRYRRRAHAVHARKPRYTGSVAARLRAWTIDRFGRPNARREPRLLYLDLDSAERRLGLLPGALRASGGVPLLSVDSASSKCRSNSRVAIRSTRALALSRARRCRFRRARASERALRFGMDGAARVARASARSPRSCSERLDSHGSLVRRRLAPANHCIHAGNRGTGGRALRAFAAEGARREADE